jgi:hypothetical protein
LAGTIFIIPALALRASWGYFYVKERVLYPAKAPRREENLKFKAKSAKLWRPTWSVRLRRISLQLCWILIACWR